MVVEAVNKCVRPQDNEILEEANAELTRNPTNAEIELTLKEMWDRAPGDDGMRLRYLKLAASAIKSKLYEVIKGMYEHRAWKWDKTMKSGNILPLFKKGDRRDKNNCRGICLLPFTSRVLAKIIAKRLRDWAEKVGVLNENQAGFRQNRSTADATQISIRLQKDELKLQTCVGDRMSETETKIVLLDLRKVYPHVPVTHSTTEFTCEAEGCGKTCKGKASLAIHKKECTI